MNEAKRIEVVLFGESYSVISDEPIERVERIAKQVDDLMQLIARRTGLADVKKIAVLAALKLATNQLELEELVGKTDNDCARLIALVDRNLTV